MQVRSFDEAIKVTVQKYNYGEKQIKQVYEALENGNFNVITNDCGARNFVINYYNALNQTYTNNQNNNQDLIINDDTNLFEYFNKVLTNNQIDKQSPEVFKYLYIYQSNLQLPFLLYLEYQSNIYAFFHHHLDELYYKSRQNNISFFPHFV